MPGFSGQPSADDTRPSSHDAGRRLIAALAIVATVALAGAVGVIRESRIQSSIAVDINEAGRHRMLVQRIALAAETNDLELLNESAAWLQDVHDHLHHDAFISFSDVAGSATLAEIERFFIQVDLATSGDQAALGSLPALAGLLMPLMDQVTTSYQQQAAHRMEHLRRLGTTGIGVILLVAGAAWFGVARPAVRRLEEYSDATEVALASAAARTDDLTEHLHRVESLNELAMHSLVAEDIDHVFRAATFLVHEALRADNTHLVEVDDSTILARVSAGDDLGIAGRVPLHEVPPARFMLQARSSLVVDDLHTDRRFEPPRRLVDRDIRSAVIAMIPGSARPFGAICALSRDRSRFDQKDLDFAVLVGLVVGSLVDRTNSETMARAERAQYERLAEQAPDMIFRFQVRPHHRLLYVNPSIAETVGYQPEDWYEDPSLFERVVSGSDPQRDADSGDHFWNIDDERRDLLTVRHAQGSIRFLDCRRVTVHTDDDRVVIEGICRDVTEFQLAQRRLEEMLDREREVTRELQQVDDMKDAFLTAVSHDLRTPLTMVAGLTETLRHHDADLDVERRDQLIDRLQANVQRLSRLVTDALDLQRTDLQDVPVEPVAIDDVIREHLGLIDAPDHEFITDLDRLTTRSNEMMICRIVDNLITNAVRHTPPGSRIWIRLNASEDEFHLIVDDDGPGVAATDRARIFEPFERGPSPSAHSPGQGIGLALVRRFAQLLSGHVEVGASPAGGARFEVSIPRIDP